MNPSHLKTYVSRYKFREVPASKEGEPANWITCPVRLAFVNVAAPRKKRKSTDADKYTCSMIIPNEADLSAIMAAAMSLGVATFGSGFKEGIKDGTYKFPFKRQSKLHEKGYDGFAAEGFFCEAQSKFSPPIVNAKGEEIPAASDEVYSGMWALVRVNIFAYGKGVPDSTKGVGFGLRAIQKLADDDVFKGGSAADAFDTIEPLPGASNGAAKAPDTANAFDYV